MKGIVVLALGVILGGVFPFIASAEEVEEVSLPEQERSHLFGQLFELPEKEPSQKVFSGNMVGIWQDGQVQAPGAFYLSQVWLTAQDAVETEERPWDLGYRVDALFGTKLLSCVGDGGFDARWGRSGDGYGAAIHQAYVDFGNGKITFRGGKFVSALGYEAVDDSQRDFNTNTQMYNHEAAANCGAGFNWTPNEKFLFNFSGVMANETSFENRFGDYGYVFYLQWKPTEKFSFSYAAELNRIHSDLGENRTLLSSDYYAVLSGQSVADHNEYYSTYVVSYKFLEKWNASLVIDHATMADTAENLARFGLLGVSPYLTCQLNEKWKAALRYEYYTVWLEEAGKDSDSLDHARVHDLSYAMIYRPVNAFFIRPEIRYDWTKLEEVDNGVTGSVGVAWIF